MEKLDFVYAIRMWIPVLRMKEIVILITIVKEVKDVDQTVVHLHWGLILTQIVVR